MKKSTNSSEQKPKQEKQKQPVLDRVVYTVKRKPSTVVASDTSKKKAESLNTSSNTSPNVSSSTSSSNSSVNRSTGGLQ